MKWPFGFGEKFSKVKILKGGIQLSAPKEAPNLKSKVELEPREIREAKEILGEDFLGKEAIEKTFHSRLSKNELDTYQNLPFSKEELELAKKLGMMLVFRISGHTPDGSNKSVQFNVRAIRGYFKAQQNQTRTFKERRDVRTGGAFIEVLEESPRFGWGLAMKSIIPESVSKNYDEQEQILAKWSEANGLDPKKVGRRSAAEAIYDTLVYYGANQKSLLEDKWDRTITRLDDSGNFVAVGGFGYDGLDISSDAPEDARVGLGVCPAIQGSIAK